MYVGGVSLGFHTDILLINRDPDHDLSRICIQFDLFLVHVPDSDHHHDRDLDHDLMSRSSRDFDNDLGLWLCFGFMRFVTSGHVL